MAWESAKLATGRFDSVENRQIGMGYNTSGWTAVAHGNVTPTDNAQQNRGASAAENDGFTRACLFGPFGATPFGHVHHALVGRCF